MHWLKYVSLNRKDRLKNIRGATLKVAILVDVSGAFRAILSVYQCVTVPSYMSLPDTLWMYLTLVGQQNVNGAAFEY